MNDHWKKFGRSSHHGICLPLFSLRSKKSCGIGEFNDLIPLIDWAHAIGLDVIQLLPLYDSGYDPSPYNNLSSCALDPVYLSLQDLPGMDEDLKLLISLTSAQRIDRRLVKQLKLELLRKYFQKQFDAVRRGSSYERFTTKHSWVHKYALFMAYKEANGGKSWLTWDKQAPLPAPMTIDYYSFLQYLSFQQMSAVHQYAASRGIFLLGDLPILLSPDSADVWEKPDLFVLNLDAGAPPDYYNRQGQDWGFPLYNWEAMRVDQFRWWQRRLGALLPYCDLYRIDHVVGLFRIWGIQKGQKASEGSFYPPDPSAWINHGEQVLKMMLEKSSLLPIAEDLGTVPTEVRACLKHLNICSTKVMRWEVFRDTELHFTPYDQYEPLSLTTVSTPDSDTLGLWWEKYPDESSAFAKFKGWDYESSLSNERRKEILRDSHQTPSFFHINLLQETLALFPELVWPNPEDERINIPGTLLPTNWTYRFRPYIEEIIAHGQLADAFRNVLLA